jgi:hypothetical protein
LFEVSSGGLRENRPFSRRIPEAVPKKSRIKQQQNKKRSPGIAVQVDGIVLKKLYSETEKKKNKFLVGYHRTTKNGIEATPSLFCLILLFEFAMIWIFN